MTRDFFSWNGELPCAWFKKYYANTAPPSHSVLYYRVKYDFWYTPRETSGQRRDATFYALLIVMWKCEYVYCIIWRGFLILKLKMFSCGRKKPQRNSKADSSNDEVFFNLAFWYWSFASQSRVIDDLLWTIILKNMLNISAFLLNCMCECDRWPGKLSRCHLACTWDWWDRFYQPNKPQWERKWWKDSGTDRHMGEWMRTSHSHITQPFNSQKISRIST